VDVSKYSVEPKYQLIRHVPTFASINSLNTSFHFNSQSYNRCQQFGWTWRDDRSHIKSRRRFCYLTDFVWKAVDVGSHLI